MRDEGLPSLWMACGVSLPAVGGGPGIHLAGSILEGPELDPETP